MQMYVGQTDASFAFFHKYYFNFTLIFTVEAGEKILQQAYNKVDEYCEKVILFAGDSSIILLQTRFERKE